MHCAYLSKVTKQFFRYQKLYLTRTQIPEHLYLRKVADMVATIQNYNLLPYSPSTPANIKCPGNFSDEEFPSILEAAGISTGVTISRNPRFVQIHLQR